MKEKFSAAFPYTKRVFAPVLTIPSIAGWLQYTNSNSQFGSSFTTIHLDANRNKTRPLYLVLVCSHLFAATAFRQNVAGKCS